jgi:hypothetical protein
VASRGVLGTGPGGAGFIGVVNASGPSPMRFEFIRRVIQRLRRKSHLDLWQFGLDVREVMLARTSQAITGELSEAEARRMVLEKQSAAVRAQLAYTQALLNGDPASGTHEVFNIYRSAVQSNRNRLRKLRGLRKYSGRRNRWSPCDPFR